jgi:hypothetical protein
VESLKMNDVQKMNAQTITMKKKMSKMNKSTSFYTT